MQFRDWMEFALYDKEKGYYANRLHSIPDYVTAPNFGPYLGRAVARELAKAWDLLPSLITPKVFTLVEVGCGGQPNLTRSILDAWRKEQPGLFAKTQVILVDRSAARLDRAVSTLSALFPGQVFGCPDVSQIPVISGAIISNELVDAFPVHLIRRSSSEHVEEAWVEHTPEGARWRWSRSEDPIMISFGLEIPQDTIYAFNREALRFLETVHSRLEHGLVMTIDFGDLRPAVFERSAIKAYANRQLLEPDLSAAGKQDLTSPVDFSLLMDWGSRLGLETIQYETLGEFLIHNGAGDFWRQPDSREAIESNLQLKALIHPQGFGDDFKVLLQGK